MKFHYPLGFIVSLIILLLAAPSKSQIPGECGEAGAPNLCFPGRCCSRWGYCGDTAEYCNGTNCQSQCWGTPSPPPPSPPPPPPSPPPPPPPSPPPPPPSPPPPSPPPPPPPSPPPPPPPSPPPPPASPPPPLPFLCGVDYGFQACPDDDMCCTVQGRCAYKGSSWCDASYCQNNCNAPPNCGINAGFRQCPQHQCCSIAGLCAHHHSSACQLHCVSQCPYNVKKQTMIPMLENVAL